MRLRFIKTLIFLLFFITADLILPKPALANVPWVNVHVTNTVTGGGVNGLTFTEISGVGTQRTATTDGSGVAAFPGNPIMTGDFGCGENPQTFIPPTVSTGVLTRTAWPGVCSPNGDNLVCTVSNDPPSYDIWYNYTPPTGTISASPNNGQILDGAGKGTSTITWTASNVTGELWVWDTTPGANGSDVGAGQSGSGGTYVFNDVQTNHNYYFTVKDAAHTQNLAALNVTRPAATGNISATPVPYNPAGGSTTVSWNTTNTNTAQVRVWENGSPVCPPTNQCDLNVSGTSGSFPFTLTPGHTYNFSLYKGPCSTGTCSNVSPALGTATVTMSPPPTTPPTLGALTFSGASGGRITGRLSTEQGSNWNNPVTITLNAAPQGSATIKEYHLSVLGHTLECKNGSSYIDGVQTNAIFGNVTLRSLACPTGGTSAQWQATFLSGYGSQNISAASAYVMDTNNLCNVSPCGTYQSITIN